MKNLIAAAGLLLLSFAMSAQDFPGNSVEHLNGKDIVLMEVPFYLKNGFQGFYTDSKLQNIYKKKGIYTKAEAVTGKKFRVTGIMPIGSNEYMLTLENKDTGVLYYKYRSDRPYSFHFEIVDGSLPEEVYCDQLVSRKEWSDYDVKYLYWRQAGPVDDIFFSQNKNNITAPHQMRLYLEDFSQTKEVIKGFTIFFENGKQITDTDIEVKVSPAITSGKYKFEVTFEPSAAQIAELSSNKVVKISMGKHERKILGGKLLMQLIKCMQKI